MELDYYGTVVNAATLGALLREAVDHTPPTTNRDLAFDPDAWTAGLLSQITNTPLEVQAHEALTAMARSGSDAELRFAAKHDFGRDLVPPDVLLDALDRATDRPTRAWLAGSLARAITAGRLSYTPRLRAVLGEPEVQDELLGAIVLDDHAAFLGALDAIFGADPEAAKLRVAYAATNLNRAELVQLRDELAASSLSPDVRAATTAAIDGMLAHPSMAKLTGSVRW